MKRAFFALTNIAFVHADGWDEMLASNQQLYAQAFGSQMPGPVITQQTNFDLPASGNGASFVYQTAGVPALQEEFPADVVWSTDGFYVEEAPALFSGFAQEASPAWIASGVVDPSWTTNSYVQELPVYEQPAVLDSFYTEEVSPWWDPTSFYAGQELPAPADGLYVEQNFPAVVDGVYTEEVSPPWMAEQEFPAQFPAVVDGLFTEGVWTTDSYVQEFPVYEQPAVVDSFYTEEGSPWWDTNSFYAGQELPAPANGLYVEQNFPAVIDSFYMEEVSPWWIYTEQELPAPAEGFYVENFPAGVDGFYSEEVSPSWITNNFFAEQELPTPAVYVEEKFPAVIDGFYTEEVSPWWVTNNLLPAPGKLDAFQPGPAYIPPYPTFYSRRPGDVNYEPGAPIMPAIPMLIPSFVSIQG